ncbi:ComEA family DNA-binding protein [Isoptericola sp. NPDC055881]
MTTTLPPDPAATETGPATPGAPDRRPPTAGPSAALDDAAARLRAWRAVREPPGAATGPPGPERAPSVESARDRVVPGQAAGPRWEPDGGEPLPDDDGPADGDELGARLRARRSARHVAAAYAAAHGHPQLDDHTDHGGGRRRWSLGLRAAVVASVGVLVVAAVVAALAMMQPDDVVTLAGDDRGAVGTASPGAVATPAPSAAPGTEPSGAVTPVDGEDRGAETTAGGTGTGTVVVHVVGEVREPGLVTVPAGARVADAVAAAGGTTRRADPGALNLARAVVDGEQIRVPQPGEQVVPTDAGAGTRGGTGDLSRADGNGAGGPVSLNTATAVELEELPGIGPALAGRIVTWRDENGPFTSVDELDEVSGIGPSVLGQVRDLVTL